MSLLKYIWKKWINTILENEHYNNSDVFDDLLRITCTTTHVYCVKYVNTFHLLKFVFKISYDKS